MDMKCRLIALFTLEFLLTWKICLAAGEWTSRDGSDFTYMIPDVTKTCDEAERYCQDQLSHLVSMHNKTDEDFVRNLKKKKDIQRAFSGHYKPARESIWKWRQDGSLVQYKIPTSPTAQTKCYCGIVTDSSEKWEITECQAGTNLSFVCQRYRNICQNDNVCYNGGTCTVDGTDGFSCNCQQGTSGKRCDEVADNCASNPCQHDGSCTNLLGDYECVCVLGWTGKSCDSEFNECDSSPCLNNGTCDDMFNSFNCSCQEGFTGVTCQTDINDCLSNLCEHGSTCIDDVNSYYCLCDEFTNGTNCEITQPGYRDKEKQKSRNSKGAIAAGVIVPLVVIIIALIIVAYLLYRKRSNKSKINSSCVNSAKLNPAFNSSSSNKEDRGGGRPVSSGSSKYATIDETDGPARKVPLNPQTGANSLGNEYAVVEELGLLHRDGTSPGAVFVPTNKEGKVRLLSDKSDKHEEISPYATTDEIQPSHLQPPASQYPTRTPSATEYASIEETINSPTHPPRSPDSVSPYSQAVVAAPNLSSFKGPQSPKSSTNQSPASSAKPARPPQPTYAQVNKDKKTKNMYAVPDTSQKKKNRQPAPKSAGATKTDEKPKEPGRVVNTSSGYYGNDDGLQIDENPLYGQKSQSTSNV